MLSDNGISRFEPLLSKLNFHLYPNRLVDKLWTNYSSEQVCLTHTWNLGVIKRIIKFDTFNKALCLVSFSWEFKSQTLELHEAASLHSHIGRLYHKCTHNYAFKQIYAICLLRGKPHPTTLFLWSKYFYPWDVFIIVKYFNHSNSVLSPLNSRLDFTQVWVEFPPLVINYIRVCITSLMMSSMILTSYPKTPYPCQSFRQIIARFFTFITLNIQSLT
jgi:hypothetical protein